MATDIYRTDEVVRRRAGGVWSGLLTGSLSTIGVLLVLLALGAAIGLAAIQPASGNVPQVTETSIAAGIWSAIAVGIACFVGAIVGTMIAGFSSRRDATSFGFSIWAVSLVGLFAFGTAATALATPNTIVTNQAVQEGEARLGVGGGGGAAVGDQPILPRTGNQTSIQRAVDAAAGATGWFVVSSLLGMVGGITGGLVGRYRTDSQRLIERERRRSRRFSYRERDRDRAAAADHYADRDRYVDRDRYAASERHADRDRLADRSVLGPQIGREYPRYERPAPPPREGGVDYRHVRDVHDDTEAY